MSLSGNITALADRVADEFNTIRTEIDGKQDLPHIGYLEMDGTPNSVEVDADAFDGADLLLTANGNVYVPLGGYNQQVIQIVAYASGADRDLTFHADLERLEGIDQTITIPSGKYLRAALRKLQPQTGLFPTVWMVEAVGVSQ